MVDGSECDLKNDESDVMKMKVEVELMLLLGI